ncbi:MAG: RNA polymerase sigma factor [Candidatus Dormibacteraceae bacterium]
MRPRRPSRAGLGERLAGNLDLAFEELVADHQDALYSFVASLSRDRGRAEEVVQDAFVRAHRALRGYEPDRVRAMAFRPWLYRLALNSFRNRLRGRRVELVLVEEVPSVADPGAGPEASAMRRVDRDRLAGALALLPSNQRIAVVLRFGQDLGYEDMAAITGRPVGTVKSDVHRGLAALRQVLAPEET